MEQKECLVPRRLTKSMKTFIFQASETNKKVESTMDKINIDAGQIFSLIMVMFGPLLCIVGFCMLVSQTGPEVRLTEVETDVYDICSDVSDVDNEVDVSVCSDIVDYASTDECNL
jgi:hypothetical protein